MHVKSNLTDWMNDFVQVVPHQKCKKNVLGQLQPWTRLWNHINEDACLHFVYTLYSVCVFHATENRGHISVQVFICLPFQCIPYTICEHMWPCITKPTKSRMAQFCVMARNSWSGSSWVIFRFWFILKEQFFFYIILTFGSIQRIISKGFCCFSRPIFLRSDGSCDHSTCPSYHFLINLII